MVVNKTFEIDGIKVFAVRDKDAPSFCKWDIFEATTGLSLMPPSWRGGLSAGTLESAKYIVQMEVINTYGRNKILELINKYEVK